MLSGFLSEHSVELVIAPRFASMLDIHFPTVTPIFYWASREGNSISRKSIKAPARIIALYPRRPKVTRLFSEAIYVKFNEELFYWTKEFAQIGIPVFAGLPLTNTIENFHYYTECLWFHLQKAGHEETIQIDLHNVNLVESSNVSLIAPSQIIQTIKHQAQLLNWGQFCETIKEVRRRADYIFNRNPFSKAGYKPIYFVLIERAE